MEKKSHITFFWILCAIEGIWALIVLWVTRNLSAPIQILGVSPRRLGLMLFTALLITVFIYFARRENRAKPAQDSPFLGLLSRPYRLLFLFVLIAIGLFATYIFVFSPLRVNRLYGYFLRWMAFFIWWFLLFFQFFILVLVSGGFSNWKSVLANLPHHPFIQKFNSPATGAILLLISFLIGLTKIYYGRFVDEADTMTVGWLISKGYILYRDVFSHHFPLSYYWAAGVVSIFGNSFIAIRISILLLQIALFAIVMSMTRYYIVIGLTSVVWNLINQFQRGHEAIYATFDSLLMLAGFVLIFYLLVNKSPAGKLKLTMVGFLLGLAVLSDPLMIYPVGVAFAGLFGSGLFAKTSRDYREGLRRVLWSGSAALLVTGVFAYTLIVNGTTQAFYRDTIWFNAEIYSKYVDAEPVRVGKIGENIVTGFNLFDQRWYKNLSPFILLETDRSIKLADENLYSSWIFTSFLFRISVLACMIGLLFKRRWAAAIFLYLFSAALLVRFDDGFYANGFTLVSIFAAFYTAWELPSRMHWWRRLARPASGDLQPATFLGKKLPGLSQLQKPFMKSASAGSVVLSATTVVMFAWLAFQGGYFIADNWKTMLSSNHINMYDNFGDQVRSLTCAPQNLELSVFPINPIVNFVTGIPPASKYVFMYPWVAEIGQAELIDELKRNPSAVVWINTNRKADSPEGVATYMAPTIDFLNREYTSIGGGLWMSPDLAKSCSFSAGQKISIHLP